MRSVEFKAESKHPHDSTFTLALPFSEPWYESRALADAWYGMCRSCVREAPERRAGLKLRKPRWHYATKQVDFAPPFFLIRLGREFLGQ